MTLSVEARLKQALLVRDMYPEFVDFCEDAMAFLGFKMTWMQRDIAIFMQYCPDFAMVQAQRGEAKSTIACIFAVWCLVRDPSSRIMLVSGAEKKAQENGTLILRLITRWDVLQYLAPDKYAGDATSTLAFDVHWALKGVDKSASVVCAGLTGSLQGFRADVLIPDDIETTKNGLTATQRAQTELLSKEFSAICTQGKILYLGTPQTKDSIYNNLPGRGYTVRIWPGRFPTASELEKYGDHLAPSIIERMAVLGPKCQTGGGLDGTRGWCADPERYTEQELQNKELDNGPEYFQLQYMLDTALSDAMRQQIKLRDLVVGDFNFESVPETVGWAAEKQFKLELPTSFPVTKPELYSPAFIAPNFCAIQSMSMAVDPAGNGGDEIAFAIGGTVGPYIHLVGVGGYKGGLSEENMEKLLQLCVMFKVKQLLIEENMGAGTPRLLITNYFNRTDSRGKRYIEGCGIDKYAATGQKERRIIETVRPVVQRHRLIVHRTALDMDQDLLQQYPQDKRNVRSLFYQMHSITTDRGCLEKDDRLDALEGLVRALAPTLVKDEDKANEARRLAEAKTFINDPMGTAKYKSTPPKHSRGSAYLRRRNI